MVAGRNLGFVVWIATEEERLTALKLVVNREIEFHFVGMSW